MEDHDEEKSSSTVNTPLSDDILAEVQGLARSLDDILKDGPRPDDPLPVWFIYAGSEKAAAILKFRMKTERPGIVLELPRSDEPEKFLPLASTELHRATISLQRRSLREGLESIRNARNYLRAYLSNKRRLRSRSKRASARSANITP